MKRLISFFALIAVWASSALAHDFEVNGIYYVKNSDGTSVSVSYKGPSYGEYSNEYSGSVNIPSSVMYSGKNYSVSSIGKEAFRGCSGLTSVTIPNSVTSIGTYAFYGCSGLTSVSFGGQESQEIGDWDSEDYYDLTSITIPNSVTSIGNRAFYDTAWFNNQPDGLVYAGRVAYKYKGTMPSNTSIAIKEGTVSISPDCFFNCSGLTSVTIPNSVTEIGYAAFEYCSGLTSVTIPNSVTEIDFRAFAGCSDLTSVTFESPSTKLGWKVFGNCNKLASITGMPGLTAKGLQAKYEKEDRELRASIINREAQKNQEQTNVINAVGARAYKALRNKNIYNGMKLSSIMKYVKNAGGDVYLFWQQSSNGADLYKLAFVWNDWQFKVFRFWVRRGVVSGYNSRLESRY